MDSNIFICNKELKIVKFDYNFQKILEIDLGFKSACSMTISNDGKYLAKGSENGVISI